MISNPLRIAVPLGPVVLTKSQLQQVSHMGGPRTDDSNSSIRRRRHVLWFGTRIYLGQDRLGSHARLLR